MRDLLVTLIVFGLIPVVLFRPWVGILLWSWLGYMNPHRLSWGFAFNFPFAQLTAVATFLGLLFHLRDVRRAPFNLLTVTWFLLLAWMTFTTAVSLQPDDAWEGWSKAMKIQLFALLTVLLMQKEDRVRALVWVIALSFGFYGLKGGLFVFLSGGEWRVWGPTGTFIADNNALALALIMSLPLMWYLFTSYTQRSVRAVLALMMVLSCLSVLGSHSRGAALAGSTMLLMLWLKSSSKFKTGLALLAVLPFLVTFMPKKYFERMETIETYQEDSSAMGRIRAWRFATELALQRPIGAGFGAFSEENYRRYAPDVTREIDERHTDFQGSHSIYFGVLGEHGIPGLALFLLLGSAAYFGARGVVRRARDVDSLKWAVDLAVMLQVGLVGYWVGGAFLGLAYFDLYYHLVSLVVVLQAIVRTELATVTEARGGHAYAGLAPGLRNAGT